MAKKRKGRRPGPSSGRSEPAQAAGAGPAQHRAHKVEARRARELAAKRAQRASVVRRAVVFGLTGVVAFGAFTMLTRASGPHPIPASALAAAKDAGCTPPDGPSTPSNDAPGGLHLAPGASYTYDQHPATSGYHDPNPLPADPHVYTSPVPETNAVHNLEHGYILIYYRADGTDALPADVVARLASLARSETKVIMAPYPDLPTGTSFAVAAWNKLWECPPTVSADQARTITSGFIGAFRATTNAPEPKGP